jgi:hypothetical protein
MSRKVRRSPTAQALAEDRDTAMKAAVYARLALASLCLLALATSASAGILVGNEWRVWPAREREAYVVGTIDGWQIVDATIQEPERCVRGGSGSSMCSRGN